LLNRELDEIRQVKNREGLMLRGFCLFMAVSLFF
jgi:hypothetical protein